MRAAAPQDGRQVNLATAEGAQLWSASKHRDGEATAVTLTDEEADAAAATLPMSSMQDGPHPCCVIPAAFDYEDLRAALE
jgi:hypothetical protein